MLSQGPSSSRRPPLVATARSAEPSRQVRAALRPNLSRRFRLGGQRPPATAAERKTDMAFIAREIALQAIRATAAHIPLIAKQDPDLTKQLKRSLTSIASNIAEGSGSDD